MPRGIQPFDLLHTTELNDPVGSLLLHRNFPLKISSFNSLGTIVGTSLNPVNGGVVLSVDDKNNAFKKQVVVRYTTDCWKTFHDESVEWVDADGSD